MGKVYDAVMGFVVGDALGVPVEFKMRDTFSVTGMTGYGTHCQPPGTWSDDSSMMLATLESMGRSGKVDPDDMMRQFASWYESGAFTPYGEVFDVGRTTSQAIAKFCSGFPAQECGNSGERDNGNGSLMRILPLAFCPCSENEIDAVSSLTHAHKISCCACRLYVHIARQLLGGEKLPNILADCHIELKQFLRIPELGKLTRDEIKSSGYVVDTLEAALWCLLHSATYRECVLLAVNLGEDTDTVAAVAGGLAGIVYGCGGESGIPDDWAMQVARREWIEGLCGQFDASS